MAHQVRAVHQAQTLVIAGGTVGTSSAHRAFATIATAANGDVLIAYRRGTTEPSCDGSLCLIRSTDKGATWGSETVLLNGDLSGGAHPPYTGTPAFTLPNGFRPGIRDVHIRTLASGRVGISFCQWAQGDFGDITNGYTPYGSGSYPTNSRWASWYMYSDDHGVTWSTPVEITFTGSGAPTFSLGCFNDDFIELPSGHLVASCYALANGSTTSWTAHLARSIDGGATWAYRSQISAAISGYNAVETSLSVLSNGNLYATFHTEDGLPTTSYQQTSTDEGATWGTRTTAVVEETVNRNSACVTIDGDMLHLNANLGGAQVARQSWDNGATLSPPVTIFSALGGFSSPDWIHATSIDAAAVTPNVGVVAAYEGFGQTQANIYFATLTRGDDAPPSPLTLGSSSDWVQVGTAITVTCAVGVRSSVPATAYSASGGLLRFTGTNANRFYASTDGTTWSSTLTLPAGTSSIFLSVLPQTGDTALNANVGVPV